MSQRFLKPFLNVLLLKCPHNDIENGGEQQVNIQGRIVEDKLISIKTG